MDRTLIMLVGGMAIAFVIALLLVWRWWRPARLNTVFFQERWKELQKLLRNKEQWAAAILDADKLLDTALKKKRIRGRNTGQRLVRAQRLFSDNDSLWFGHKLRNKIAADPQMKLREKDVKQALVGIRQALKDVGALPQ
jgi:hypothetical protein